MLRKEINRLLSTIKQSGMDKFTSTSDDDVRG